MIISETLYRPDDYGFMVLQIFSQDITYVTFDIEVDGFFAENSILKFDAIKYSTDNEVIDSIEILAKPREKLHPHISLVTGFTDDMFLNAMSQEEAVSAISDFLADTDVIIGYNIESDLAYLNKKIPELSSKVHLDILEMLRDFFVPKLLNGYSPEEVFSWYDIGDIPFPEALNILLNSMLEQYIHYFETAKPKKLKPKIRKLYYMVEFPKPRKLYINTDLGQFSFDIKNMNYKLSSSYKIDSIEDVDMEHLRKLLLNHFHVNSERDLYSLLLCKTEYTAILN